MSDTIRITQIRSSIRRLSNQRATLRALGLRGIGRTVTRADSPQLRGMLRVVSHLVAVEQSQ